MIGLAEAIIMAALIGVVLAVMWKLADYLARDPDRWDDQ